MAKKPVKYYVVDAFTDSVFKGNPAAVCFLEEDQKRNQKEWLQVVAAEFNVPTTCYLTRLTDTQSHSPNPRFRLSWFTPVAEVKICGHATLAAAHTLFTSSLLTSNVIEFVTVSGTLTARKNRESHESFLIELDFPTIPMIDFNSAEFSSISNALNGASVIDIKRTTTEDDLIFDLISRCPGRGIIISGAAPPESGFDYYYRFFCPKFRVNEDSVCGSANCALALYWSKRLGKCDLVAYAASPRSGVVNIHLDEQNQRVLLRGKAVTVMEGSILV
ncbi:putative isomerase [Fagus crenata]